MQTAGRHSFPVLGCRYGVFKEAQQPPQSQLSAEGRSRQILAHANMCQLIQGTRRKQPDRLSKLCRDCDSQVFSFSIHIGLITEGESQKTGPGHEKICWGALLLLRPWLASALRGAQVPLHTLQAGKVPGWHTVTHQFFRRPYLIIQLLYRLFPLQNSAFLLPHQISTSHPLLSPSHRDPYASIGIQKGKLASGTVPFTH